MYLKLEVNKIEEIHWIAEKEYLFKNGFHKDDNILREEHRNPDDCKLEYIEFNQDETPKIGGDNIECEYLQAFS